MGKARQRAEGGQQPADSPSLAASRERAGRRTPLRRPRSLCGRPSPCALSGCTVTCRTTLRPGAGACAAPGAAGTAAAFLLLLRKQLHRAALRAMQHSPTAPVLRVCELAQRGAGRAASKPASPLYLCCCSRCARCVPLLCRVEPVPHNVVDAFRDFGWVAGRAAPFTAAGAAAVRALGLRTSPAAATAAAPLMQPAAPARAQGGGPGQRQPGAGGHV